jgi:hypothetical protein
MPNWQPAAWTSVATNGYWASTAPVDLLFADYDNHEGARLWSRSRLTLRLWLKLCCRKIQRVAGWIAAHGSRTAWSLYGLEDLEFSRGLPGDC